MSVLAWNCHALIAVLWFQLEPMNQVTKRVQTPQFQAAVIYQTSVVAGITDAEKVIKLVRSIPSICSGDPRKADEVSANGACHLWKCFCVCVCVCVFFLGAGGAFNAMFILRGISLRATRKQSGISISTFPICDPPRYRLAQRSYTLQKTRRNYRSYV